MSEWLKLTEVQKERQNVQITEKTPMNVGTCLWHVGD